MKNEIDSETVKKYGIEAGATVVGIAASRDFVLAPDGFKPTDVLPECNSVIVLGTAFSKEAFNSINEYSTSRNAMLSKMTDIAKAVAKN